MGTLDNLRKDAKRWLKALRSNDADARARLARAYPNAPARPGLRDVQHALAREHGHASWKAMTDAVAREPASAAPSAASASKPRTLEDSDAVAHALSSAYAAGDADALARLGAHYRATVTHADVRAMVWRAVRTVREAGGAAHAFGVAEARAFVARQEGFGSWDALAVALATGTRSQGAPYVVDTKANRIGPRRRVSDGDWDAIIGVMKEQHIVGLDANGFMTDAVLARIAELDHVVHLSLGGSRQLTEAGLQHLARMPQLRHLDLSEYPGGVLTDRGLEVLRHLPELRTFDMTWQRGISDAGVSNLKYCDRLESVNLMGSPTGDGAIEALREKPHLRRFSTGRLVTDAGLPLLQDFPLFRRWRQETGAGSLGTENDIERARLLLDGPFSNRALGHLAGLDGLTALGFFWHVSALTSDALASLRALPNLRALEWGGELCDDIAMRHIGALPNLRKLMAQGTVASDDGFAALSRSQTIESIWGRECPNLTGPGFTALSRMPVLRELGVSCARVDDESLAALPRFPALRQLTSVGIQDDGFRYVGRCEGLEHLSCMYCRDTTDAATAHIARLPRLKTYYAGATQITDRSLEILGTMTSLEGVELYECLHITNAGISQLARLPRLRQLSLSGLPHVTLEGAGVFSSAVHVEYLQ